MHQCVLHHCAALPVARSLSLSDGLKTGRASFHLAGQHVLALGLSWTQETVSKLKRFYWLFSFRYPLFTSFLAAWLWMRKEVKKNKNLLSFFAFYSGNKYLRYICDIFSSHKGELEQTQKETQFALHSCQAIPPGRNGNNRPFRLKCCLPLFVQWT